MNFKYFNLLAGILLLLNLGSLQPMQAPAKTELEKALEEKKTKEGYLGVLPPELRKELSKFQAKPIVKEFATAIDAKDLAKVKELIAQRGVDVYVNNYESTPLLYAINSKNQEILNAIADANPNFNAEDYSGNTALNYAARRGNYPAIQWLLNLPQSKSNLDVNYINSDGFTALDVIMDPEKTAAGFGRILIIPPQTKANIINALRRSGAKTAAELPRKVEKPVVEQTQQYVKAKTTPPLKDRVQYWLKNLAKPDYKWGLFDTQELNSLLAAGMDPNVRLEEGARPALLELLKAKGNQEAIKLLQEKGATTVETEAKTQPEKVAQAPRVVEALPPSSRIELLTPELKADLLQRRIYMLFSQLSPMEFYSSLRTLNDYLRLKEFSDVANNEILSKKLYDTINEIAFSKRGFGYPVSITPYDTFVGTTGFLTWLQKQPISEQLKFLYAALKIARNNWTVESVLNGIQSNLSQLNPEDKQKILKKVIKKEIQRRIVERFITAFGPLNFDKETQSAILKEAVRQGSHSRPPIFPLAQLFLDAGFDINAQGGTNNDSALLYMSERTSPEAIKFLLDHGANPNLSNNRGEKALDIAIANVKKQPTFAREFNQIIKLLEERGAQRGIPQEQSAAQTLYPFLYMK